MARSHGKNLARSRVLNDAGTDAGRIFFEDVFERFLQRRSDGQNNVSLRVVFNDVTVKKRSVFPFVLADRFDIGESRL
ncbi:MAG: hypothetical protein ACD_39C00230G0003 [uncultured bacterium]|nr:MAG: hypothetical protein ACD_39C00230G0003 [uncultured bacterium]